MARSKEYSTLGRNEIINYLKECQNKTCTVAEIHQHLLQKGVTLNITTIYRFLDKLLSEGTVLKYASSDNGKAMYQFVNQENNCNEHLHMKCVKCGRVIHLDCDFMNTIREHMLLDHQFKLQCKDSVLYGICESCQS